MSKLKSQIHVGQICKDPNALVLKSSCEQLDIGGKIEKVYKLSGIVAQFGTKNRNGRYYTEQSMVEAVDLYNRDFVAMKRAAGELGHPKPSPKDGSVTPIVDPTKISHYFQPYLSIQGEDVYGEAIISQRTPNGIIACNLIDDGMKLSVSTRGLIGYNEEKAKLEGFPTIQKFVMTAIDIVHYPSAPKAEPEFQVVDVVTRGIAEGAEWIYQCAIESALTESDINDMKRKIHNHGLNRQQVMLEVAADFISKALSPKK